MKMTEATSSEVRQIDIMIPNRGTADLFRVRMLAAASGLLTCTYPHGHASASAVATGGLNCMASETGSQDSRATAAAGIAK